MVGSILVEQVDGLSTELGGVKAVKEHRSTTALGVADLPGKDGFLR